jgi:hypothetical protein
MEKKAETAIKPYQTCPEKVVLRFRRYGWSIDGHDNRVLEQRKALLTTLLHICASCDFFPTQREGKAVR